MKKTTRHPLGSPTAIFGIDLSVLIAMKQLLKILKIKDAESNCCNAPKQTDEN